MNTEFNTKEEYLSFRTEWRARYKEVSVLIRQMRVTHRSWQNQRSQAQVKRHTKEWLESQQKDINTKVEVLAKEQGWKYYTHEPIGLVQSLARQMMDIRYNSKIRAGGQMKLSKLPVAA